MTLSPERDLEELRAATACPTWVQTNYAIEKTHTNVLAEVAGILLLAKQGLFV